MSSENTPPSDTSCMKISFCAELAKTMIMLYNEDVRRVCRGCVVKCIAIPELHTCSGLGNYKPFDFSEFTDLYIHHACIVLNVEMTSKCMIETLHYYGHHSSISRVPEVIRYYKFDGFSSLYKEMKTGLYAPASIVVAGLRHPLLV